MIANDYPVRRLQRLAGIVPEMRVGYSTKTVMLANGEGGVALILALFFTVIVVGVTVSGTLIMRSNEIKTRTSFVQRGQAVEIAKSGLTEALGWFRKQTSQPATNFQPVLDLLSDPQVLDTEEPDIGIVRQWKITGAVWCRYEVWKDWSADPDPERLAWRNQMLIRDVSAERRAVGSGAVWKLRSIGYVFRRVEPTLAFDQFPNQVIGHEILEMEIRRLSLQPPGQSAVSILDGNSAHINTKGRIIGGSDGAGIFYPQGTGTPTTGPPPPRVTGTPPLSPSLDYYGTVEDVFGVSPEQLTAMADQIITDPDDFPAPVPSNSISVSEVASINFDNARPLQGTGIVYIK